jgi:hypothetical protein
VEVSYTRLGSASGYQGIGLDWIGLDWTGQSNWIELNCIELDWTGLDWIGQRNWMGWTETKQKHVGFRTAPHLDETCIHVCMYVCTNSRTRPQTENKRRNESNRTKRYTLSQRFNAGRCFVREQVRGMRVLSLHSESAASARPCGGGGI